MDGHACSGPLETLLLHPNRQRRKTADKLTVTRPFARLQRCHITTDF